MVKKRNKRKWGKESKGKGWAVGRGEGMEEDQGKRWTGANSWGSSGSSSWWEGSWGAWSQASSSCQGCVGGSAEPRVNSSVKWLCQEGPPGQHKAEWSGMILTGTTQGYWTTRTQGCTWRLRGGDPRVADLGPDFFWDRLDLPPTANQ